MPFSGMRLSVSLYLQVRECWMVGGLPRREVCLDWTMWGVCGCWFCVSFWAHSPGASFGLRFLYRWGPARWSWRTPYTGVRRLQRAGLCRCGSRKLRFAPGEWAWDETWNWQLHTPHMVQFERVSRLGGLLVIWHFLTCKYFDYFLRKMALLQPLLYSLQLWLSTGHVEMVENEKFLHSNSAKIAVPDWSILRSVKEPHFRITPSRADVPLIPEWIVETYFHS